MVMLGITEKISSAFPRLKMLTSSSFIVKSSIIKSFNSSFPPLIVIADDCEDNVEMSKFDRLKEYGFSLNRALKHISIILIILYYLTVMIEDISTCPNS